MTTLTTFITIILALSVASERTVEVFKGIFPTFWLFAANANPVSEARRCALLHVFAGLWGGVAAYFSHTDVLTFLDPTKAAFSLRIAHGWASFVMAALLTSAGSAFWNHALDILQATKVQREQGAIAAVNSNAPVALIPQ